MPLGRKTGSGAGMQTLGTALTCLILTGCMGGTFDPLVTKLGFDPAKKAPVSAAQGLTGGSLAPQDAVQSSLIPDLQARESILSPSGAYAAITDAVVDANAGAAAAELRVARLKAEAKSKNWLPQIGPSVSLTSLGGLAASLMLEAAVFDNGRRKAEREFAAADVEVAAVSLSAEINQRVFEGLILYVKAERARAQAAIASDAAVRLDDFENIMSIRVSGGISDGSEQSIVRQHAAEMRATLAGDQDAATSAMTELAAMSSRSLTGISGLDTLPTIGNQPEPLSVMRARGEAARMIAEANIERAGLLPGLTASIGLDASGITPGLNLGTSGLIGLGTGASLAALQAETELADRRTADASEDANRKFVALKREIITLQSRETEGAEVLRQTAGNFQLFSEQYKVGRRSLLELVGQFDSYARLERDQAALKYEIALRQLEIARDRGLLVDGDRL